MRHLVTVLQLWGYKIFRVKDPSRTLQKYTTKVDMREEVVQERQERRTPGELNPLITSSVRFPPPGSPSCFRSLG